jgi:hypothetical protein
VPATTVHVGAGASPARPGDARQVLLVAKSGELRSPHPDEGVRAYVFLATPIRAQARQ